MVFLALMKLGQNDLNWNTIFRLVYIPGILFFVLIVGHHLIFKKHVLKSKKSALAFRDKDKKKFGFFREDTQERTTASDGDS